MTKWNTDEMADMRGKVVTPAMRKTIRDSIEKWWRGDATTQEEAE